MARKKRRTSKKSAKTIEDRDDEEQTIDVIEPIAVDQIDNEQITEQAAEQTDQTTHESSQYDLSPEFSFEDYEHVVEAADGGNTSSSQPIEVVTPIDLAVSQLTQFSPTFDSCGEYESETASDEELPSAQQVAVAEQSRAEEAQASELQSQVPTECTDDEPASVPNESQISFGMVSQLDESVGGMFAQITPVRSRRKDRGSLRPAVVLESTQLTKSLMFSPCKTRDQAVIDSNVRPSLKVANDSIDFVNDDIDIESDATSQHAFEPVTEDEPIANNSDARNNTNTDTDDLTFVQPSKRPTLNKSCLSNKSRPVMRIQTFSDNEVTEEEQPLKHLRFVLDGDETTDRPSIAPASGFNDFDVADDISESLHVGSIDRYIEKPTHDKPYIWEPHQISPGKRKRKRSSKVPKFKETLLTLAPPESEKCLVALGDDLISDSDFDSDFAARRVKRTRVMVQQQQKPERAFRIADVDRESEQSQLHDQQDDAEDAIINEPTDINNRQPVKNQISSIQRHLRAKRYSGGSQPITSMIALPLREVDSDISEPDSPIKSSNRPRTQMVSNYFPMSQLSQVR